MADVLERLDDLRLLELALGGVVQRLPLAAAAVAHVPADFRTAQGRGLEYLVETRLGVARLAAHDGGAYAIAGHRAAHEDDEAFVARHALAAIGERRDVEVDGISGARGHGQPVYPLAAGLASRRGRGRPDRRPPGRRGSPRPGRSSTPFAAAGGVGLRGRW